MRKLFFLSLLMMQLIIGNAQNEVRFGLQTGATMFTFKADVSISNAIASTVPPINEFSALANFQAGFWFEKRLNSLLSIRWEVERSPGGAKAYDILEEREKRYKFFYLSSPIIVKLTAFQKKIRHPIQLEAGVAANLFLFDYGEDITFGTVNKWHYHTIVGLTRNLDNKWAISIRYLRDLTPFSTFEAGGVRVNWTNKRYVLSFSRALFTIQKKKKSP